MRPEAITLPGGEAALLWAADRGAPGVVIVHGYGSRKENHADFGAAANARGMAALALDLPGHGDSGGRLDGGALEAVVSAVATLADRGHGPIGVRGSSLGGMLALAAPTRSPGVRAVVAICPARPERLARLLEAEWPRAIDLEAAVRLPGVARGYWHARGDDRVPWQGSFRLANLSPPPVRLHIAMGGGHTTLQHDPRVLAETAAFLAEHLGADG